MTKSKQNTKNTTLRTALRAGVFLLLAAGIFVYLNMAIGLQSTEHAKKTFNSFYAEKDNSLDVVYVGSSAACRFFIPPLAYEEQGIASFNLAAASMPAYVLDNIALEAERSQDPDLYVVELRSFRRSKGGFGEPQNRRIFDSLDLTSPKRVGMVKESVRHMDKELSEEKFSGSFPAALFPVLAYHDRVLDGTLTMDELLLKKTYTKYKGYQFDSKTRKQVVQDVPVYSTEAEELTSYTKRELQKVLDAYDKIDAQVLYVLSPRISDEERAETTNALAEYVTSQGKTCLNLTTEEAFNEIGLDYRTDFYDGSHVNYLGAEKYTRYLSQYLKENYDLEDRRGDSTYQSWSDSYADYQKKVSGGPIAATREEMED